MRALVLLLVPALLLSGCAMPAFLSCKAVGPTEARFGATWTHGNSTNLDDALAQSGFTRVDASKWVRIVNESFQVFAVTASAAVGPASGIVIGFDAHGTNVTSEDEARVALAPYVGPVLRAAEATLGAPAVSTYEGGHVAC